MSDLIERQEAIDLLWKTLFAFEDENEKEFSEEWYLKIRPQVQNISDADRQAILNMPAAKEQEILDSIAKIISISPLVIQEDVFRYKMICEVMEGYKR